MSEQNTQQQETKQQRPLGTWYLPNPEKPFERLVGGYMALSDEIKKELLPNDGARLQHGEYTYSVKMFGDSLSVSRWKTTANGKSSSFAQKTRYAWRGVKIGTPEEISDTLKSTKDSPEWKNGYWKYEIAFVDNRNVPMVVATWHEKLD